MIENASVKLKKNLIFKSLFQDIFTKPKKVSLRQQVNKSFGVHGTFRTLAWCHKSIELLKSILHTIDNKAFHYVEAELNDKISNLQIPGRLLYSTYHKFILGKFIMSQNVELLT